MNDKYVDMKRPKVLLDATETQIQELERQFDEGDKPEWQELTTSYGWSDQESEAVWQWFSASPEASAGDQ